MKKMTALLAVGSLVLAACGSSSSSSTSSTTSKTAAAASNSSSGGYGSAYGGGGSTSTKTTAAVSNAGSGKTISIGMADYKFTPATITGKPGQTVTVKLTNTSSTQHNFKIDGQPKADADVAPGKSGTAVVKIPTSGTLQFYCEYHKGLGMVGTVKPS